MPSGTAPNASVDNPVSRSSVVQEVIFHVPCSLRAGGVLRSCYRAEVGCLVSFADHLHDLTFRFVAMSMPRLVARLDDKGAHRLRSLAQALKCSEGARTLVGANSAAAIPELREPPNERAEDRPRENIALRRPGWRPCHLR